MEATSAEARSVHDEVEAKVATLAAQTVVSVSQVVEAVQGHVSELAAYSDARLSHVTAEVTQRSEGKLIAVVSSTATMAEIQTRTVVEGAHMSVEAQLAQTRADTLHREEEPRAQVNQLSAQLQKLTDQLNQCKPASEKSVGQV